MHWFNACTYLNDVDCVRCTLMPVAGVRLPQDPLRDIITRAASLCSDEDIDCYLVDDGAFIVYSNSADDEVSNISSSSSTSSIAASAAALL